MTTAQAHYFPVARGPLRMRPGLSRLGTDFGNGSRDERYLQVDDEYAHYWQAKRQATGPDAASPWERHAMLSEDAAHEHAHAAALAWLRETAALEGPRGRPIEATESYTTPYDAILRNLQEDAVLMHRAGDGPARAIMAHVCFPSSWRPESILGQDFHFIHQPVPDFAELPSASRSMEDAMLLRGPYVRFIWTLTPDDSLDLHPDSPALRAWAEPVREGWLRVERQVTVPLRDVDACLFLIRVYRYPLASLQIDERRTIANALAETSAPVLRYKRLWASREALIAALEDPRFASGD